MLSEELEELFIQRAIEVEYEHLNKNYISLSQRLINRYGYTRALDKGELNDFLFINFDVVAFCFTKSLRLFKSIDALIAIFNYEDAFALLRGAYEAYLYIAFLNKNPNRVTDSIFKVGLEAGIYIHPLNKQGKTIKNKIIDTQNNNLYDFGTGVFERASSTEYIEDVAVHNVIYKFLSEHSHVHFMSSGNYRDETKRKARYSVDSTNHNQFLFLIFLKTFIYSNIFIEMQRHINFNSIEDKQVKELNLELTQFLNSVLKTVSFNDYNGLSMNKIFQDRIAKRQS